MNKTATLTLIAIISSGALMAAGSSLAQQAGPAYGSGYGPGAQGAPCPRGGRMGPGGWNGSADPVAARLDRMAWRLNLTDAQKAKLEPILRQRQELRTAQRQQMRNEVAAILTPEQLAQFDQMGPGRGGRMGRAMGPGWNQGWNAPSPATAQ
jgi:Spy/CpxP family protein refolding chaperone